MWGKNTLVHWSTVGGNVNKHYHEKSVWRVLRQLKINPTYPLFGYLEMKQNRHSREWPSALLTEAQFITTKIWNKPKCPWAGKWAKELWLINSLGHYSATKRMKSYLLRENAPSWKPLWSAVASPKWTNIIYSVKIRQLVCQMHRYICELHRGDQTSRKERYKTGCVSTE